LKEILNENEAKYYRGVKAEPSLNPISTWCGPM